MMIECPLHATAKIRKHDTTASSLHPIESMYTKQEDQGQGRDRGTSHACSLVVAALLLPLERVCNLERKTDVVLRLAGIQVQQQHLEDEDAPSRMERGDDQGV